MKKLIKICILLSLFTSLFGCTKPEEEKPDKPGQDVQEPKKEPELPPETEFFNNLPDEFYFLFENLKYELSTMDIGMEYGVWDENRLRFDIRDINGSIYFSFSQEGNIFSISLVEQELNELSFIKECCMRICDPDISSITSTILNIVASNNQVEFNGNTYSQDKNTFTIQLDTREKVTYTSPIHAALSTYSAYDFSELDRLYLTLNAYAQAHREKHNSIHCEGNIANRTDISEQSRRYIETLDNRMEITHINSKNPSISFTDNNGNLTLSKGQNASVFVWENGLNPSESFLSQLSLDRICQISKLKKDKSLDCMATMTNTALIVTINGVTQQDNRKYNSTIILTDDEISVNETIDNPTFEQQENYTYSFESLNSIQEQIDLIYSQTFTYETFVDLLNKYL